MQSKARATGRERWLRLGATAFGLALLGWTLRDFHVASLKAVGPAFLLALFPLFGGYVLHALAWQRLLTGLGENPSFGGLLRALLAGEAARIVAPAGPAVGESVAASVAHYDAGVSWRHAWLSLAGKKAWVVGVHGCVLATVATIAHDQLALASRQLFGSAILVPVAYAFAFGLTTSGLVGWLGLGSPALARWASLTIARVRRRLVRRAATADDATAPVPAKDPVRLAARTHLQGAALVLGQWLLEALDTWLLLHLVSVPLTFGQAFIVELGVGLLRAAAFLVPGALGVQEGGYLALIGAFAGPAGIASGALFVISKRAKEAIFAGTGFALLVGRKPAAQPLEPPA